MIDLIDMIPSKDMRKALRESGRYFTDMERATIVANLGLLPKQTRGLLQQIKDETQDRELRKQLQAHLDSEDRAMESFKSDSVGNIYYVEVQDDDSEFDGEVEGYFSSYQIAYEFGLTKDAPFWVRKSKVYDAIDANDPPEAKGWYDFLKFDADGELLIMGAVDPAEYGGPQLLPNIIRKGHWPHYLYFEDRFISLPNLYEQGDIVRIVGKVASYIDAAYDWAVVDPDRTEWEKWRERVNAWLRDIESGTGAPDGCLGDFSDMQITVEIPCKDGTFTHDHINPMFLEKWDDDADGEEAALMRMASHAAKGECGLEWISHVLKSWSFGSIAKANMKPSPY